ncbi:ty3-gypsy retrotransposon protein [Tanacetum coccineum]|uniref:Ty3-gypsy retrotransposon protein n=1 Tax=Tanacetum coccineum TaxID=301880 RepID=A0ABQ5I8V7_9ASTR
MEMIIFLMKGDALSWYQWMFKNNQLSTWNAFTTAVELRFGPSSYDIHEVALFKLKQTSSVTEYQWLFEKICNRVPSLAPSSILNCFISRLKYEIQRELKLLKPTTIIEAIGQAKLIEDKATPTLHNQHLLKTPPKFLVKRLSFAEQQERRARGLCFNCDEKYRPGHRCIPGEYLILEPEEPDPSPPLITKYNSLLDPPYPPLPPLSLVNPNTTPDNIHFQLSVDASVGLPSPRTLRLCGIINGHQVSVLVDSGSSHNIIQPRVAKFLQLQISNAPRFSVLVGNGDSLTCSGLCLNVPIYMQQNMFNISFYVLPISGADVVLGVQWLQTLGQILSDYSILVMQFQHDEHLVTLTGKANVLPTQTSFNYRSLNVITIPNRFPIPTVDELLDELYGAQFFSKIDLRSGYHQIQVANDDTYKTAFRTVDGNFEFLVMPFGLTNAPSTFQSAMNDLFRSVLRQFVLVFFDDILIYSKSFMDHMNHIEYVLHLHFTHQFFVKPSKCVFGVSEVSFLGHIIDAHGLHAEPDKVHAIMDWPLLKSMSELRGFLSLTGYYRRFVKGYAAIAIHLTDLLKSSSFQWNPEATHAFNRLKEAMVSLLVLALPDFTKPFDVETDASGFAIGVVLSQRSHPIAYFSKKLNPILQSSSTYTREMFAITEAHPNVTIPLLPDFGVVTWVVVDRLSKYAHFIALPALTSAAKLAFMFATNIFKLHGNPKVISFRQVSVQRRRSQKLATRYYGPFRILRRIGPVAYELELPPAARIHNVFHVSLLKKLCGEPSTQTCPLPRLAWGTTPEMSPIKILGNRSLIQGGGDEVLVQWDNAPADEATWEDRDTFLKTFPTFDLEDKVGVEGEGSDTDHHEAQLEGVQLVGVNAKRQSKKPTWMHDYV